jgi:hypothetical protein
MLQNNNPSIRNADLSYNLLGMTVTRPKSEEFAIAPGFTQSIFNGTRNTAIDSTTAFTVSQPSIALNTFRFTWTGGTAPAFRTSRVTGIDNTTQFAVTVNGGIALYTYTGTGTAPDFSTLQIGDQVSISAGSGFNPVNQGVFTVIGKNATSFSIQNLDAVAETVVVLDPTLLLLFSNGASNNQAQIGDKLLISAGFSQYTQGTYVLTNVTPNYIEITAANPNGLPIESGIMPGAAGFVIYSNAKKWVMIAAQQRCSVQANADVSNNTLVEPTTVDSPETPGLYLKNGTTYALSVTNLSLETLVVTIATAE